MTSHKSFIVALAAALALTPAAKAPAFSLSDLDPTRLLNGQKRSFLSRATISPKSLKLLVTQTLGRTHFDFVTFLAQR
jgi:hypothetical protein